jgi:hypothetical protein
MSSAGPSTTTIASLEGAVQKRLGIKYVDSKRLVEQALMQCEIAIASAAMTKIPKERYDEVLEEACEIFADLDVQRQDEMRISTSNSNESTGSPAWMVKAQQQAAQREAEWETWQRAYEQTEHVQDQLRQQGVSEEEVSRTRVISIKQQQEPVQGSKKNKEEEGPVVRVTTHTCYCVIL